MPKSVIDHLVVTAPSLETGAEYVRKALGAELATGGEHPRMKTHNLLLKLGESLFLEVIAPVPNVSPNRPRWFALDTLSTCCAPALVTWVVGTSDIQASASACSEYLGNIEPMSRGALDWLITIPADGELVLGGVAPALIEWAVKAHPASALHDHGFSLAKLELFHPQPERVARLIHSLDLDGPLALSQSEGKSSAHLVAHINTPHGIRLL